MAVRPGLPSHPCQAPARLYHEVCADHPGSDKMGAEEEHRAESDGGPGEGGGDADEKKAEVAWSCSSDGGNPHPQLPASMQAGWWQALSW